MAGQEPSPGNNVKWPRWLTPLLVAGLLAAPVTLWWYLGWLPAQHAWVASLKDGRSASEKFGTYGDGFGAVNSLASSLALGGVAIALLLQWREQRDARLEAKDNEKREIDLAMLAALVHGRSALLETLRTMANVAEQRIHNLPGREEHPEYPSTVEAWESLEKTYIRQMKELTALIDYAEISCGWNVTKVACMPHLSEYYRQSTPSEEFPQ